MSARPGDTTLGAGRVKGALLLAAALGVLLVPLAVTDAFLLKVFTFVGINVIVVVGLSLLFGYAGQVSMGHAAFFGIGAFTSAFLTTKLHWPWLLAIAAAMAVSALGGLALAMPSLRLKGHYLAMATLGFGQIMSVIFVEAEPVTGGTNGTYGIPPASVGPVVFSSPAANYWLVAGIAVIVLLLARNMVALRPGRAMRALHGSEFGAQACGVDPVRLKVQVFVVSAVLAGVAGSLYAHLVGFISPSLFTLETSILLVAMTVLGGTGSLAGPVIATAGLTLLPYVDALIPGLSRNVAETLQDWRGDIYGLTIILVMLYMPGGLAGASRRLSARLRPRAASGPTGAARQGGEAP